MARLKVLLSAYSCEPGSGSEPGVGWNVARVVAHDHDVWVVTLPQHRRAIEQELGERPVPGLHAVYYDLPWSLGRWASRIFGMQIHYYLWQLGVFALFQRLHVRERFDVAQHVTFVKYWQPSSLARLDVPYVWGPVGGADASPAPFLRDMSWRGRVYEFVRNRAIWCGERDPMVIGTARRSALALAATAMTAERLRAMGAARVEVCSAIGLSDDEHRELEALATPAPAPVRFLSIGRLIDWKAFHLGLRAFAAANLPHAEYWIIGSGPALTGLQRMARRLGVSDRVRFLGSMPRTAVLERLGACHVLVHPSLHDSGSCVSLEALAAGRPVICMDLGGPGHLVTDECGIKISALTPADAVAATAVAMRGLALDPSLRRRLGDAGRQRVRDHYLWRTKARQLSQYYAEVAAAGPAPRREVA